MRRIILTFILLLNTACVSNLPNIKVPQEQPPAPKITKRPRVALVLGSGGARGFAHLGVIKILQDNHIPIDLIVGASAGSIVGAIYADNLDADKTAQLMLNTNIWSFVDFNNFFGRGGMMEGGHMENFLLNSVHAHNIEDLKIPFVAVTTDLETGETYPITAGPIAPAILASAALPGFVKPVHLYNRTLIDGGNSMPVPVAIAKQYNPQVIIAVNVANFLDQSHPIKSNVSGVLQQTAVIMWDRLVLNSLEHADIVIEPDVLGTGMFDTNKKQQMFANGEHAALQKIAKIQRLLKEKHIA